MSEKVELSIPFEAQLLGGVCVRSKYCREDYNNPKLESTCEERLPMAEKGSLFAETYVGWLYYLGIRCTQDYAQAEKWIRKAAEQGLPEAQISLATLYAEGKAVKQDYEQAYFWSKLSEKEGVRQSSEAVANQVSAERRQTLDKQVETWTASIDRDAAEHGSDEMQYWLGILYNRGWGVKQDDAEAAKWWRKAAEQGNPYAQRELSTAYALGVGVKKDMDQAYFWDFVSARIAAPAYTGIIKNDIRAGVLIGKIPQEHLEAIEKRAAEWKPNTEPH